MIFKIPQHYIERGRIAYERIVNEVPKQSKKQKTKSRTEPVSFDGDFNKSDYFQIPEQDFVMAIAETNGNLKYEDAHRKTIKQGLIIPTPNQFMISHNYIIDAKKNNIQIFDAAGNLLPDKTRDDLYKQYTENCWTWLNGKFNISENKKEIEYISGLDKNNNFVKKKEDLSGYLLEDCYIDFTKLTSQGLGMIKSSNQNYVRGENIYFYFPRDGQVGRFIAGPDRSCLVCYKYPLYGNPVIRVRAAKEVKKNE